MIVRTRRHPPLPRHLLAAAGTATLLFDLPAQQVPDATTTIAATDWLRRLDDAFLQRDLSGYLACFAPDHRGLHDVLRQRLADWLEEGAGWRRSTTLVGALQDRGNRLVAHVRHQINAADGAGAPFVEQAYVVFAPDGRKLVPTVEVELPAEYEPRPADRPFHCPPCNFQMGGLPQWLCVPVADRARALDTACFLLLGTDVTCELQIDVRPDPLPATTVIEHLTTTTGRLPIEVAAGPVSPWLPTAMPAPPAGFTGCTRTLDLEGQQRARLHVACFGHLSHTLLIRGGRDAIANHDAAITGLLATYRMVDIDCKDMSLGAIALAAHTGSTLTGIRFQNGRFGITCDGPELWTPQLRAGGHAFQCIWSCPERRSRLFLTGHAAPRGMPWDAAEADRELASLCRNAGLEIAADSGWTAGPQGAHQRDLALRPQQPGPGQPIRRWLRALVFADLLVILDGYSPGADDAALTKARDSFQRQ